MPTGNFELDKGFRLASGQTATKFRAVKLSAAETVTPVTAVGDVVIGVAQNAVSAAELLKGKGVNVRVQGITEMETAGAVAVGDIIAIDSAGRAKGGAPAAGDRIVGVALTAATNSGDRFTMVIQGAPSRLFTTGS